MSDEAVRSLPLSSLWPCPASPTMGAYPHHRNMTVGVIPDEAVRSLPLSSLWPHLSGGPRGSVIPTAACGSLPAPFVRPHHGQRILCHPRCAASPICEASTIYLIPSRYVLLLVLVPLANE